MYKPNQRQIQIEILAAAGWVAGTLHVAERSSLLAFLNKKAEYLPLTDVPLSADEEPMDFLALRRAAAHLVVPEPEDIERHPCVQPGTLDLCRLRCLFADATVEGTIRILSGQRVSDFLETNPGYFLLSDCLLQVGSDPPREHVPHVIVNAAHLLAVADLTRREHAPLMFEPALATANR